MNITTNTEGSELKVALEGRLDTTSAPELEAVLKTSLPEANSLVLDLEKLEYMSSAGLRVLLATHKQMVQKGGLKVTNVNDVIKEIFEITGFSDILTVE